ncbi:hypothetical protein ONZ45_g17075 [Pleurotus djamor]|nr:hypothetical protein ONZ45_g17075 [Pleurotus djamor]
MNTLKHLAGDPGYQQEDVPDLKGRSDVEKHALQRRYIVDLGILGDENAQACDEKLEESLWDLSESTIRSRLGDDGLVLPSSLFSLENKVALVTGGQRGLGLEVALGFAEAGAIVYCIDLPQEPDSDFEVAQKFASELPPLDMATDTKKARLEYISADVTDQPGIWKVAEEIVAKEGRLDICFANAGIVAVAGSLEFPADKFTEVVNVNVNGALYTAQAAGRQMEKLGIPGSIIFMASICGSVAIKVSTCFSDSIGDTL